MTWTNGRTRLDHRASARDHRRYDRQVRRGIAGIGRALVTVGILLLLFVVYQLWGTGVFTARAQDHLKTEFRQHLQADENDTVGPLPTSKRPASGSTTSTTFSHKFVPLSTPSDGSVEGLIQIPAINVSFFYVEGTSRDDLKKGPGHYPGTPLPGTLGNAGIAGHRTTYLHPFGDLDKLKPGDDIIIGTLGGTTFDYKVDRAPFNVYPTDVWVVGPTPDAELTLTACTPKGSAAQRIVVKAKLAAAKSSPPTRPPKPRITGSGKGRSSDATLVQGLSGQQRSLKPSIVWGIIVAAVGLMWWWAFRRWRHPRTWLLGVLPFLIALIPFYVYLERALPSGY
jgi:sortase A